MPKQFTASYHTPHAVLANAAVLAQAARLLSSVPQHAGLPLAQAMQRLQSPLALGQYRMRTDASGTAVSLATWAWLSDCTLQALPMRPLHALHRAEWNEGEHACICDVIGAGANATAALADVLDLAMPRAERILCYPTFLSPATARFGNWARGDMTHIANWFVS